MAEQTAPAAAATLSPRIAQLKKKAAAGNAVAQVSLGLAYDLGEGVPEDEDEAVQWYRLAAAQGDVDAQMSLGAVYWHGQGVPKDQAEGVKWYRLAAAQGNARAQYFLGVAYRHGEGVPQDKAEGVKWYRLAAAQGHASAQAYLNRLEGVKRFSSALNEVGEGCLGCLSVVGGLLLGLGGLVLLIWLVKTIWNAV